MLRPCTLAALAMLASCSLVFVRSPPDVPPPPPEVALCTRNPLPPVLDTLVAVLGATGALYFSQSSDDNANVGVVIEGGIALGFGISAITGWRRTSKCRALSR